MKRLMILLVLFLLAVIPASCTDEDSSRMALKGAGYADIQFTGYEFFSCGERDQYHTGFTAKDPTGSRVRGVVCCGLLFKACTIRFE